MLKGFQKAEGFKITEALINEKMCSESLNAYLKRDKVILSNCRLTAVEKRLQFVLDLTLKNARLILKNHLACIELFGVFDNNF